MATSKLQDEVRGLLSINLPGVSIKENYRPDWMITDEGNRLELDFYIEELGIAIEVQGEQHFQFVPFFHGTYEGFEKRLKFDNFKRETCYKHGVSLFEIADMDDAHGIIPSIQPIWMLYCQSVERSKTARKQMIALAMAWQIAKESDLYLQVKKAQDNMRNAIKFRSLKSKTKQNHKSAEKYLHKKAKIFHELNDQLYKDLIETYIKLFEQG